MWCSWLEILIDALWTSEERKRKRRTQDYLMKQTPRARGNPCIRFGSQRSGSSTICQSMMRRDWREEGTKTRKKKHPRNFRNCLKKRYVAGVFCSPTISLGCLRTTIIHQGSAWMSDVLSNLNLLRPMILAVIHDSGARGEGKVTVVPSPLPHTYTRISNEAGSPK